MSNQLPASPKSQPKRPRRDGTSMMTRQLADNACKSAPDVINMNDAKGPDGAELVASVGRQVRTIRRSLGITLSELSSRSGLSVGMLSKIEGAHVSPSFGSLQSLARGLDVPVATLFADSNSRHDFSHVRAGQGVLVQRRGSRLGHHYKLLGHVLGGEMFIEPYHIEITDKAEPSPDFQHTGLEFIYILTGRLEYRYADKTIDLGPGDSLLFNSSAIHGPQRFLQKPISYLSVCFNLRA